MSTSKRAAHSPGWQGESLTPEQAGALLKSFIETSAAELFERLMRERGAGVDPLIRSDRLGPNNRIVLGLIARGELAAVKLGGRYHVRASEWARYVAELEAKQSTELPAAKIGPANDAAPGDDDVDAAADRVLAELGLERKAPRAAGRGRR